MEPSNLRYVSQVAYALKYGLMSETNLKYNHLLGNYIKRIAEESYSWFDEASEILGEIIFWG